MYNDLAKFYDVFMADVDYLSWATHIAKFLDTHNRGVDFGCGSGKMTIMLSKLGYDVIGIDRSEQMLLKAMENSRKAGSNVLFLLQDMTKFTLAKPIDFATVVCDGVNYLSDPYKFFVRVYENLNPHGKLIFDISTSYKLINILGNNSFTDSTDEVSYIWQNSLAKDQKSIDLSLDFFEKRGELYRRYTEKQRQYIYEKEDLLVLLNSAGFECEIFGDNFGAYKRTSERAHFVATKL